MPEEEQQPPPPDVPFEPGATTALSARAQASSAAIAVGQAGIAIANLNELMAFASYVMKNGAAPKGMNAAAVALACQAGMERGFGPLWGLQAAVVVNGVLSWRGWAVKALIRTSPLCVRGTFKDWVEGEGEGKDMKGVVVSRHRDYREQLVSEFSMTDAIKAGLSGKTGPWTQHPKRMLKYRAIGFHGRDHYPEVLGGLPIEDEANEHQSPGGLAGEPSTPGQAPPARAVDPLVEELRRRAAGEEARGREMVTVPVDLEQPAPTPPARDLGDVEIVDAPYQVSDAEINEMLPPDASAPPAETQGDRPPAADPEPTPAKPRRGADCMHWPAIAKLKHQPIGAVYVCEDCTLTVKKEPASKTSWRYVPQQPPTP